MRLSIAFLTLCISNSLGGLFDPIVKVPGAVADGAGNFLDNIFGGNNDKKVNDLCSRDVTQEYKKAMTEFHHKLYTQIAARSDNHFVFSPYTIWLSLSALAEGADPSVQTQIFASLNLPQEFCIRRKFYDIALNVEKPGRDVTLKRRRTLFIDNSLKVYRNWGQMVRSSGLLTYSYVPIKEDPKATTRKVREFLSTHSRIVLRGNSDLLDSLDYDGLWTTAFPEAGIQSQPFFNELGQKIGTVDMMHMKKQVRLANVPFMGSKVLELPVGVEGRYTMLIAVGTGNNVLKNAIDIFMGSIREIFSLLQMSPFPLNIAIPRFALTSEFDVRPALEEMDIRAVWRDSAATKLVSNPAAKPGGLIQRVSIKVGNEGVSPLPTSGKDLISGLFDFAGNTLGDMAKVVGHEFVADRPFMFALFDTETRTCLFTGAFSKPNPL